MMWREWNWWNIFILMFLIVILSLEVVNYIHIQNNTTQLSSKIVEKNKEIADQIQNFMKKSEDSTLKSIKDVSNDCVAVFKDILSH